jgi:hypothetical protein
VAHCQHGKLNTTAVEKSIACNEQSVGPLASEAGIGRVDLANGAGVEELDL